MRRILFLVCVLAGPLAVAQNETKLTFREAVQIGLKNNLALNQAKNNLTAAAATRTAGVFSLGPTVSIQGNVGRNDGNSFNQQRGEVINGVLDFMGANLVANMPVFNGGSNLTLFMQVNELNNQQLHMVKRTSQDVIRNVAAQYLTCLLDQQLVLIQQKNVETQRQQYYQIKEQVSAGSRAEVDAFNQEYQLKNAELLLLRSQNTLRNDKTVLAASLQIDPLTIGELDEPGWDVNAEDASVETVDELSATALEARSDLQSVRAFEKASKLRYYSNMGNYLPSVNAFAQYGSRYNYAQGFSGNRSFDDQFFSDNVQLTYGLSFNIPIFGGLSTRNTVVRSKMDYENARLGTTNVEISVKTSVLLAKQNYNDARSAFESSTAQLRAAEVAYNFERERYSLGISDIVVLTLATQNYTRAQSDFASSKYTLMFQKLMINYAVGTLTFEDIP